MSPSATTTDTPTLVVVPTYQEAGTIGALLTSLRSTVPGAAILVVDDNSPDGTADLADMTGQILGSVHVLRRPAKAGLGSAYRTGFAWGLACGYEVLVEMDADLSHDPADLPRLLDAVGAGADLAIGSRYVAGGSIPDWSWHRRTLSRVGNAYSARWLRLPVLDATSGYRAYRADVLRSIDIEGVSADGYGFQIETAWRVTQAGGRVVEVPIAFGERLHGASKMSAGSVAEAMRLVTWWGLRQHMSVGRHRRVRLPAPARA
jgi:dolichol-phosphate mannosyltransferase